MTLASHFARLTSRRELLGVAAVVFAIAVSLAGACVVIAERSIP